MNKVHSNNKLDDLFNRWSAAAAAAENAPVGSKTADRLWQDADAVWAEYQAAKAAKN